MHVISPYRSSVTLFGRDGTVRIFRSLNEARRALGLAWIARHVGEHFVRFVCRGPDGSPKYDEAPFVMRDDTGRALTAEHFRASRPASGQIVSLWYYLAQQWDGEGPVPFTGKRRHGYSLRRPRTMQERRLAANTMRVEGEPAPRASRSASNLPDPWGDERLIASREDRSWKRYRRQQHKEPRRER